MLNDTGYERHYYVMGMVILVMAIYVVQLFRLQVIDNEYKRTNTAIIKQTIYPQRGLIYDRDSTLLVFNQPAYDVMLVINEMNKYDKKTKKYIYTFDTLAFCNVLSIDTVFFNERIKIIKQSKGYSPITPQIFMTQLQHENIATLQELLFKFNGVYLQNRMIRNYTYPFAAHVLGNIGEVSQDDINKDNYYSTGDYSGRDGIEKTYESALRGVKGARYLMRNNKGVIQGSYKDGEMDIEPIAGKNLVLTIDIELQAFAEKMLEGKIGSAVAIEPATGEILALISNPTWDPQMMVGRKRGETFSQLNADPTKPLFNRALSSIYPPGSTFKPLQALVALEEGAITENTMYPCSGPGSNPIKCTHHHGSPNSLLRGIEQSCNPYFWYVYKAYLEKNGYGKNNEKFKKQYNKWRSAMQAFGLAQEFKDSDIGAHGTGAIYREASYNKIYGETGWNSMTIRSNSIGQGEVVVTPLQMANYTAAIANEGYYITPHLNKADSMKLHKHDTGVKQKYFKTVKEGMRLVMVNGTGRHHAVEGIDICGKTGTAQTSNTKDNALFIAFAPKDNPKIAVAVVVENCGFGATWAAPIGTLMIEKYINDTLTTTHQQKYDEYCKRITNPNVIKRMRK